MIHKKENNFAYIDGANLHKGAKLFLYILDQRTILAAENKKAPNADRTA